MIQAPSMTSELNPFLCCLGTFLQALNHQSAKETFLRLVTNATKFKGCKTANQNCLAKTHREDVLYRFLFLITEGAVIRVGESSFFVTGQLSNNDSGLLAK